MTIPALFAGVPAPPELLLVVALVVLLFGASKIPALANSLGRSTKEFSRGRAEVEREIEEANK